MEQYITGAYTSVLGRVTKGKGGEGNSVRKHSERLRRSGYDEKARAGTTMKTLLSRLLKLGSIYFTSSERVGEWSNVYSPELLTDMMVLYECLDYSAK